MSLQETLRYNRLQLMLILPLLAAMYFRIVPDMVKVWYLDGNYSHGFIVPVITFFLLRRRWPELEKLPVHPADSGLAVLIFGLFQLLAAWFAGEFFTMRTSLIVILAGLILFLFGREVLKGMAVPLGYLVLMVPIPYIIYDMIAFPLKLFVTRVSVALLRGMGVVVMREGNIIMFPATVLEVADACSGIRSLVSLVAFAGAYVFMTHFSDAARWIIILSAIPIAVATNVMRVVITGILAQWWGTKAAEGFFHEFAGATVFLSALILVVVVGETLRRCQEHCHD